VAIFFEDWSPDSKEILFTSSLNDTTSNFYTNTKLFALNIETGKERQLAHDLDEYLGVLSGKPQGFTAQPGKG